MDNILDHIFSSSWILMFLFFIVIIGSGIMVYATNFFKSKILNYSYKAIFVILPFSPIILDSVYPIRYGFSNEIPEMCIVNNKLCFLDKKSKGNETGDWEEYRLHVLNAENGEKISREFYDKIYQIGLAEKNHLLLYGNSTYILVDINTNKPFKLINKEYLQAKFTELYSGIESLDYSNSDNYTKKSQTISVISKTAKTYYYEPFTDKLLTTELNKLPELLNYELSDDEMDWRTADNKKERFVSLAYSAESNKIKHLVFENKTIEEHSQVAQIDLLEPEFLQIFPEQKLFVLVSYKTTDKLNFILQAIDFKGKKLWQIKQSELNLTDNYVDEPKLNSTTKYNGNFIFNCGGFIVSMEAVSGKVLWKQRV